MIILDAHLPPALAVWISETFDIPCFSAQFLDLRHAEDEEIFTFSKTRNAIVITKDDDFVSLLNRFGSPPKVFWLTCGNTSKSRLKEIFEASAGFA
jgi:predicted nuclease of predicted toxin-antitoxin system